MSTLPAENSTKPSSFTTQACLLSVAIGVAICLPLYIYGLPIFTDLQHHYRTAIGFYESILKGNYYPSWHPSTNGGYGDLSVRFYPPVLYYMLAVFRLITRDWFLAGVLTVTSLASAGALGMYLWARQFVSHSYALAAGLLFAFSPFHASEIYHSGLYGQYAAASVIPFVFAFLERIIQGGRSSDVALLGLSYGLFVLANVPLAVLGSISIAIYALIRLVQSSNMTSAYRIVAGGLLGVALSCFYWLPVLRELRWKSPSGIEQGIFFDYRYNFLLAPSPSEMNDFLLPLMTLATFAMAVPTTILLYKRHRRAIASAVIAVLGFSMSTPLSRPLWDRLPILQETQFPWRWMTITSTCLSLLVALSLSEMSSMWRSRLRPLCIAFTGLVLIALSFTIFQLMRGAVLSNRGLINQSVELLKESKTNQDFLPTWANLRSGFERTVTISGRTGGPVRAMKTVVEAPNRSVNVIEWSDERKIFSIEQGQDTDVRLKTYYYPYWLAFAKNHQLVTTPADDGALMVKVPSEKTTITVTFIEPLSTYISSLVSTLALLMIVLLLVLPRQLRRIH